MHGPISLWKWKCTKKGCGGGSLKAVKHHLAGRYGGIHRTENGEDHTIEVFRDMGGKAYV